MIEVIIACLCKIFLVRETSRLLMGGEKLNRAERITSKVINWSGILGVVALLALLLLVVTDIFLRNFFNSPIKGGYELAANLMAFLVFLSLGRVALKKGHVSVDIVVSYISKKSNQFLESINNFVVMGLCLLIAKMSISQGLFLQEMGRKTAVLKMPIYPFYLVTGLGFILLFLAVLLLQFNNKKDNK